MEKATQWYANAIESTNGDWDELKDKFYLAFFPMSHIVSLPRAILDFDQYEKEYIAVAWARFLALIHATQTCLYLIAYCCDSFAWVLTWMLTYA